MRKSRRQLVPVLCAAVVIIGFFFLLQYSPPRQDHTNQPSANLEEELPDLGRLQGSSLEETVASLELTPVNEPYLQEMQVWRSRSRYSYWKSKRFENSIIKIHWTPAADGGVVVNIKKINH